MVSDIPAEDGKITNLFYSVCSVEDPLHVGVDPDPDPRIHASD